MKIRIIICISFMSLLFSSSAFSAAGNVRFTVHNLSNNNSIATGLTTSQRRFASDNEDQVCVFCHTPHNATPASPLWNKVMPSGTTFKFYSSGTRSSAVKSASLPNGSVSLLCLSCHDGKTAVNVLHNTSSPATQPSAIGNDKIVDIGMGIYNNSDFGFADPATGGVTIGIFSGFGGGSNNLGKTSTDAFAGNNLTDDHPIGFSYSDAYTANPSKLKNSPTGVRFFAPNNRMECSTCHDPHVNYNSAGSGDTNLKPFLIMSNAGSALCLTCHVK